MNRLLACGVLSLIAATGCGPKPEEVAAKFETTFNSNDAAAIVDSFANEPFVKVDGVTMLNRDEITAWLSNALTKKPQIKATSPMLGKHGRLNWTMTMERSDWQALALEPLPYKVEAVFDKDKVKMLLWTIEDAAATTVKDTIAKRNERWLTAMHDAIKTRNPPAVAQLVTDDVRIDAFDKTGIKKTGINAWVQNLTTTNTEINCCVKKQSDSTWAGTVANDAYRALKLETVAIVTTPTFADDGHIKALSIALSPEAKAKVEAATTAAATTAAATSSNKKKK